MNIIQPVLETLRTWTDQPVFLEVDQSGATRAVTAGELSEDIERTADSLVRMGVQAGGIVMLTLENSVRFVTTFLSLLRVGAIPSAVKMEYRSRELGSILANARPHVLITEEKHLPILRAAVPDLISPVRIIVSSREGLELRDCGKPTSAVSVPGKVASVNYTYRGLGYPVGALVTHEQYYHGAQVLQAGLQASSGERMLVILPMAHIFTLVACLFVPLLFRLTSVVTRTLHPRKLFRSIRENQVNYITSVPEIYELFLRSHPNPTDTRSLRAFVSGGSHLTDASYHGLRRTFDVDVLHGYGMTEFTPISRNIRGQARAGTIGPICDGVEWRIREGAVGGELLIKSRHMAAGYLGRPELDREVFEDGWMKTGDLVEMAQDHLVWVGEKKGTRKVNGNIIDLEEIRLAIREHEGVDDVQVGCQPGGKVTATVTCTPGVDLELIIPTVRVGMGESLATYKIPRDFRRAEEGEPGQAGVR